MSVERRTELPGFGKPTLAQPKTVQDFLNATHSILRVGLGRAGSSLDRWVTIRDLYEGGLIRLVEGTTFSLNTGSNTTGFQPVPGPPDYTVPPTPTGLLVAAGMGLNILRWDNPAEVYGNHSYTEVWRADTDNIGVAQRIGTTDFFLYSDSFGDTNVTYYYWIRFVSKQNKEGPFNATTGTQGTSGYVVAENIFVNNLSAISADLGTITAGTVTGATIQTATSGARIVLNASNLVGYDSLGNAKTTLSGSTGVLTAVDAIISGTFTATVGAVGGFTIGPTSLTAGSGATTVAMDSGGTNPAFYAGSSTPGSAPFRVLNTGALVATNATITGAITISSGSGYANISDKPTSLNGINSTEYTNYEATYTGTVNYRTAGAPTNTPTPSGITITSNTNGTANIQLDWSAYTQGANKADLLFLFWTKTGTAPTVNDSCVGFNVNTSSASYYVFEGVNPADTYSFGLAAARRTESGMEIGTIQTPTSSPDWLGVTSGTPNYTANVGGVAAATVVSNAANGNSAWGKFSGAGNTLPAGNVEFNFANSTSQGGNATNTDAVGSQTSTAVQNATINFNGRNDRTATAVVTPTIASDGTAVDHAIASDSTANISFEWAWGGTESDIDGFIIFVRQSTSSSAYTFGTTPAEEQVFYVTPEKRAFLIYGVAANQYYTFGVQAYRIVDPDVNASGVLKSSIVKPSLAAENPYQPSTTVAFAGDVTGTVNGVAAATVSGGAQRANTGLDSSGNLVTKVIPASNVAPSGAGLYLGADFLGYYGGAAWKTYMDNTGRFFLTGTATHGMSWNGTDTLDVVGHIKSSTMQAATFYSSGSHVPAAVSAAATTVTLKDASGFASSGSGYFIDSTNDLDAFSWTGKSGNDLTGCSGVLAHNAGAVVVSGKSIISSAAVNEMRFFGDRGDGTIEQLASIGINQSGSDFIVGNFGSGNSSFIGIKGTSSSGTGVYGVSSSGFAVWGSSSSNAGVKGESSSSVGVAGSSSSSTAVYGESSSGTGVHGVSSSGIAVLAETASTTRGSFKMNPKSNTTDPSSGTRGEFYVRSDGVLRFHDGTSWKTITVS